MFYDIVKWNPKYLDVSFYIFQGTEGFKNAKKGTAIAAQTAAIAAATVSITTSACLCKLKVESW